MSNFSYLLDYCRGNGEDLQDFKFILELNVDAEEWIYRRVSTSMMILRQSNEEFIKFLARKHNINLHRQFPDGKTSARSAVELIDDILVEKGISYYIKDRLHTIRQVGNEATHNARYDDFNQAQAQFQNAYELLQMYFQLFFAPESFKFKGYEQLEPPSKPTNTASITHANSEAGAVNESAINRLFVQAESHRKSGRYQEARANYEAVLAQDPNHGRSLFQLGVMYEKDRAGADLSKAIECYEKAVALGESYAHASLADCLLMISTDTEHRERIFELLEKGLSFDNPSNRAYIVYVKIYEQGLLDQAVDLSLALDYAKKAKEANFPKSEDIIARIEKKLAKANKSTPTQLQPQTEATPTPVSAPMSKPKPEPISVTESMQSEYEFAVEWNKYIDEINCDDRVKDKLPNKLPTLHYSTIQSKDGWFGHLEAKIIIDLLNLKLRISSPKNHDDIAFNKVVLGVSKSIKQFNEKISSQTQSSQQSDDKKSAQPTTPKAKPTKQTLSDFDDSAIHHTSQSLEEQKKARLKELREKHFGFNLAEKSYIEWIKEAHTHKSAKNYNEAIKCFEQGLSQYTTTDNHLSLCECYLKVGKYREAQQLYLKISEENQKSYFHQHAYKIANVGLGDLYFNGWGVEVNLYKALEYYQKANHVTKINQAEQAIRKMENK